MLVSLFKGLFTCYVILSKLEKSKGKFNYFQYIAYRYQDNKILQINKIVSIGKVLENYAHHFGFSSALIHLSIGWKWYLNEPKTSMVINKKLYLGPYWPATSGILYYSCRDNWLPVVLMTSNFDVNMPDKLIVS